MYHNRYISSKSTVLTTVCLSSEAVIHLNFFFKLDMNVTATSADLQFCAELCTTGQVARHRTHPGWRSGSLDLDRRTL